MGTGLEIAAYAALAVSTVSAVKQVQGQQEAAREGKKGQREQEAMNAARAAQERRQQIREERIRRARILQSSENTGVSESSGQIGAEGSLATQLSGNVGFNRGQIRSAGMISDFQQNAQDAIDQANLWGQVGQLSGSIFGAAGGFNTVFGSAQQTPQAGSTAPANISRGGGFSPSN